MSLTQKYAALKLRVGGNREVNGWEYSMGMTHEEKSSITPPGKWIIRILSEIEFSIRLSSELDGIFDSTVERALDFLTEEMDKDGVLTNSACKKAEEIILPLTEEAKKYKLILAGHAHIDMNWMWSWQETVAATLATTRTMLNIMDEYPEFCFSQSQAAVYKIIEDYDPELMERVKERIASGRWEITATSWVETDKNMPATETLLRHIKYTKNYFEKNWGIDPGSLEIDFSPDTFGHSANMPEIDLAGGVKYMYHCRGLGGDKALYRFRGQSGAELIVMHEQYWYNSAVTPKIGIGAIEISKRSAGFKTGLIVYGVGDHGGGPTRRDVERAIDMMSWPVFPKIKFGTFREFFKEAESVRESLPVVEGELNFVFPGCYTTQSRIKQGSRQCEAVLSDAENLAALACFKTGENAHNKIIEHAWRNVLFNDFHDILTGSCKQESREYAMGQYQKTLAQANTEYSRAMRLLSENIDTSLIKTDDDISNTQSEGAGVGYNSARFDGRPAEERGAGKTRIFNIFNPTTCTKAEPVEITVWDWTGNMGRIKVTDSNGNELSFQLLDYSLKHYWDHKYFRVLVYAELKPLSYTTIVLSESEISGLYPVHYTSGGSEHFVDSDKNVVLDNGLIRAEFDFSTGEMISLRDVLTGKEYLKQGSNAGFMLVDTERSSSDAWNIGRWLSTYPVNCALDINGQYNGELRSGFHVKYKIRNSTVTVDYMLDKGAHSVAVKTNSDWSEVAGEYVPLLVYVLPLADKCEKYVYDIPAGYVMREPMELDVPATGYAAAPVGDKYIAISADSKYGYRAKPDGTLVCSLINSTYSPDPYPERGIHSFTLSVGIFDACPKKMEESVASLYRRLSYAPTRSHSGALAPEGMLFDFETEGAVISAVTSAECGNELFIRMYSVSDSEKVQRFSFTREVSAAHTVDICEAKTDGKVSRDGKNVSVRIPARSIVTVRIVF